jgi:hypothetical protein
MPVIRFERARAVNTITRCVYIQSAELPAEKQIYNGSSPFGNAVSCHRAIRIADTSGTAQAATCRTRLCSARDHVWSLWTVAVRSHLPDGKPDS